MFVIKLILPLLNNNDEFSLINIVLFIDNDNDNIFKFKIHDD